ncbi:hypothetical protein [Burkholderia sp. PU8-34]
MPNVTFFIAAERMPPNDARSRLTAACNDLCTRVLHAAPDNVHVIYVGVGHGRGHPVYVEIRYRLEAFRTPDVMDRFLDALDDAIRQHTGCTARIRCFGYPAPHIHARH